MKLILHKISRTYLCHNKLGSLNTLLKKEQASKCLFIVSKNIDPSHWNKISTSLTVPYESYFVDDGESLKTLTNLQKILKKMLHAQLDRKSLLVCVGGGSLSDTCGLAAALYLRGIRWGILPTTPLSQVDACLGGKTAVNFYGKNILGTFYNPEFIFIDTSFFSSLAQDEINEGLIEAAKMALGFDKNFFKFFLENPLTKTKDLHKIIERSLQLKEKTVLQDPHEKNGIRHLLNFGHTFGHVFERVEKISHGKAVAKGLVLSMKLSRQLNMCNNKTLDNGLRLIDKMNVPYSLTMPSQGILKKHLLLDKKRNCDRINFVFLKKIGLLKQQTVPVSKLILYGNNCY